MLSVHTSRRFFSNRMLGAVGIGIVLYSSAATALAECDPSLDVVEVSIEDMQFVPATLEICLGQTVRWTNNEPAQVPRPMRHTVTFDESVARDPANVLLPDGVEPFGSGALLPGEAYEYTFEVAGEYKYFCRPHELMGHVGALTVIDPSAP